MAENRSRQLRDAVRRLMVANGGLEEARRPCGAPLSMSHAYTLLELSSGPLTVTELASRLAIDRTNVSRLSARLERAGELTRAAHPADGRAVVLELTAKGRELARGVDASSSARFARLSRRLGAHAKDVVAALQLLEGAMRAEED